MNTPPVVYRATGPRCMGFVGAVIDPPPTPQPSEQPRTPAQVVVLTLRPPAMPQAQRVSNK